MSNTDPGKTWTWVKFKPSLCDGCFAGCCTLPVEVTKEDLVRLELISEDEATGSLKKAAGRLQKARLIQSFRAATGLFTLAQKPNNDCIFLNSKRQCTVYDKRPSVCRDFPTVKSPRIGFCPHQKFVVK